jgi:3-keto-5-aminohexanoate cleavage enzyme
MASVVITVGPTGGQTTREMTPHLPTSPDQIANEVTAAYHAGATVASLHFRDANHRPTADLHIARRTVELVQEQSPILVQVSSGVSTEASMDERLALMELRPQMATLSPCSMTFGAGEFRNPPDFVRRLAGRMQELNIKPELEIYDTGHVPAALMLQEEGLIEGPLQFGIVLGVPGGMAATAANLVHIVQTLPVDAVWQAIAVGRHNFELAAVAMGMGGNVRTGLEDNIYLARGELSPGNAPLVTRMAEIATAIGRPVSTVEETATRLGLPLLNDAGATAAG